MLTNHGTIIGGAGGSGGWAGTDGLGGVAITLATGATLINTGTITGGVGGYTKGYSYAYGGNSVYLDGGTLIAKSGTISGGAPGPQALSAGPPHAPEENPGQGFAVQFGAIASTLVVDPGATLSGGILANPVVNDTLILQGTTAGTMTGFGNAVWGFNTIAIAAHANWTLTGTIDGTGTLSVGRGADLRLEGAVSIASLLFAPGGHATLSLDVPTQLTSTISGFGSGDKVDLASINAASLSYSKGTLTLFDAGHNIVDTLGFAGSYTNADFALQSVSNGTDLLYAGTAAETATLPTPHEPAAFGSAFGFDEFRNDMLESWHALVS